MPGHADVPTCCTHQQKKEKNVYALRRHNGSLCLKGAAVNTYVNVDCIHKLCCEIAVRLARYIGQGSDVAINGGLHHASMLAIAMKQLQSLFCQSIAHC